MVPISHPVRRVHPVAIIPARTPHEILKPHWSGTCSSFALSAGALAQDINIGVSGPRRASNRFRPAKKNFAHQFVAIPTLPAACSARTMAVQGRRRRLHPSSALGREKFASAIFPSSPFSNCSSSSTRLLQLCDGNGLQMPPPPPGLDQPLFTDRQALERARSARGRSQGIVAAIHRQELQGQ